MEELQKSLRDQYSDDNEAYKAALASNGITPGNSTGKVRSIQQAYYDGNIDKGTRDYMMADAIAKFARNTGRDIGNIGAQFTGGTVNNNFETSDWNKRNEELFKQQTSAEAATIANSDKAREATAQNLANEKSDKALAASRVMEEYKNKASAKAEELRKAGNDAGAAIMEGIAGEYALLTSGATSSIDKEEHIGNILASLGTAVGSGAMTKKDMMGYINTVFAGLSFGKFFSKEDEVDEETQKRNDVSLEQFKQKYPNATEEDYETFIANDSMANLKFVKDLEKHEKQLAKEKEKQRVKDEKALKEQQKKDAAAAKVKEGYTNSYNNVLRNLENGNKVPLNRAWNNFANGRHPFDNKSYIDNVDMKTIQDQAKQILTNKGQNWLNQDGTPSEEYQTTVLKLVLDNL